MKNYFFHIILTVLVFISCKTKDTTATSAGSPRKGKPISAEALIQFQEKFFLAQSEKALGNPEKAYIAFGECLQIDPASGIAHYEIARIERGLHEDAGAALGHIKAAVASEPSNAWYQYELADTYMALGKYELAAKTYKEVARLNPNDPNVMFEQASALLYLGKTQEAIDVYDLLENKSGPYEELSFQKHQLYIDLKNYEKAGEELEKLANAFPEEPRYWGITAQYYQQIKQPEKALSALEKMKKADPDNGEVHFQLSEYYAASGDDKRSYEELKKAFDTYDIAIDQKIGVLLKYYTLTEVSPSFLPQAYELLEITEKIHPDEAKVYAMYGDFLYRDGEDEKSLVKYKKALELDETRNQIWSQVLAIESTLDRYADVEKGSTRAMELFPNLPEFYYLNGVANERLKNYSKAAESLSTGKELVIENDRLLSQFYSSLGTVYHYLGKHDKSDEAYDAALAINPADVYVLNNYAYYLSLRKVKLAKANEMARLCNELSPGNASFEDTYAWVLYQEGKYEQALAWVIKAVAGSKENGEVLEHQGDILFKLGKKIDALESWKKAAQSGGASEYLQQKIDQQRIIE